MPSYSKVGEMNTLQSGNGLAYEMTVLDVPHANAVGVQVLRVKIDLSAPLDSPQLAVLSDSERARGARFLRKEDALRHTATRAALRTALAERLSLPAATLAFEQDGHGRPWLDGAAKGRLDFNVSHAGSYALIAIAADRRVGVDIEVQRENFDWRAMARSVLAGPEAVHIESLPESQRLAAFFDVWTAKEALLKALGTGIVVPGGIEGFSVLDAECGAQRLPHVCVFAAQAAGRENAACYDAVWCDAPAGYAACVAWSRAVRTPHD